MKAVALDHGAAVRHGLLWHVMGVFSTHEEVPKFEKPEERVDFLEDLVFFESAEELDEYVRHLSD